MTHPTPHDFWTRVRTALSAATPVRMTREPAYGRPAIGNALGLRQRIGAKLDEALRRAWDDAAQRRAGLGIAVLGVDRFAELHRARARSAIEADMERLFEVVSGARERESDLCLRLGAARLVLILPDRPLLLARAAAKRAIGAGAALAIAHRESHAGIITLSAGIATMQPQGAFARTGFEAALSALTRAQSRGLGQMAMMELKQPASEAA